ncbi:hypothetical protein V865_006181 [Kwoniella europaea PYCC6329]|uniref:Uncharacterized protein n=1 Tax=Kwoniella europaea PYCC6329 TaxID=1423913 RepID=A0AAX4KNQ2_9TREE
MTGTCTLHHFQRNPFHFTFLVGIHSPRTAKIGDNSLEAQLSQPVFRRLAPQTSLLQHWECDIARSTNGVNRGPEENRFFPQRVDSASSKQVRLSFPPPVAPTRTTTTTSAGDPHIQYRTPLESLPVDIDRIPPTPAIDLHHTHSAFIISPSRRDRSASQSTFHPFSMPTSASALPTPVSLRSTTGGDHLLAQAHQKVDKLSRKAFRTNQELEVAQREFKALEDAGEVVRLRNQLQDANERIDWLKSNITAKSIELNRYWSSNALILQNEYEVEMNKKDERIKYLQVKVGILENQVADWTNAIVGSTRPRTGDKAKPCSAPGTAPRGILRKPTRIMCQSGGFAPRPAKTFSDNLLAIQDGPSQTRAVPSRELSRIVNGNKEIEASSRWNLDHPSHLTHDPNPAEGDWSRKRKARQFQWSASYPGSEASQRNPEATYPFDIFDQLPDLCDLDTERDVGPEEGDEVLVNGIKMKYLVEHEAEKKSHGLDHINRDIEAHVKEEADSQDPIEEDALGIEEWDGFGEQDWDGFGVQDLEGYGVADDDGFGVADDDGFGEVDLEGYGYEEYEGFGVEEDDGFLIEEDDGLFVC